MKSFFSFIISFAVLFGSISGSYAVPVAASNSTVVSNLKSIKCSAKNNQVQVAISIDNYEGYKTMYVSKPDRLIIDIPNSSAPGKQQIIKVDSKLVKSVRYAQNSNKISRVVIDTVGQPKYQVEEKKGQLLVYVLNSLQSRISYYSNESGANLIISGLKLPQPGGRKLYTEKSELSGKKYTITFPSSLLKLENKITAINDEYISSIQVVKNTTTKKTSIVIRAKSKFNYETSLKEDVGGSLVKISNIEDSNRGEVVRPELPQLGVSYSGDSGAEQVVLSIAGYKSYNVMRLTGPDRIVMDVTNASTSKDEQKISVNSKLIRNIRYAQYDESTARVVVDTTGQAQYNVVEKDGQIVLTVESVAYSNVTYNNNFDRVFLQLEGVTLTEGGDSSKKLFTDSYDETGRQYTMTFPANLANIGNGTLIINDSLLESIQIVDSDDGQNKSIIFNCKDKLVFETVSRQLTGDTAINVIKPATKEDRLIVIDPGHGGIEPGAVSGNLLEKDLNLDIALRVNELLKSKGVKTYMTRQDDRYVGLYERAYLANDLNAEMFLSIHNNAYYASETGTETLYFPERTNENGFGGKRFAQIIQDFLIGTLGTKDRKIKSRPGLVVLKATKMPAALAEIAFMTNPSDKAKLLTDEFKQKAAEALCNAVLKAMEENVQKN